MRDARAQPVVVVAAAGAGRRFGASRHKLLQPLGDLTVLGATLRNVVATLLPVVVVASPEVADEAVRWVAARDVIRLASPSADRHAGMGRSIAAGITARPQAPGWLVLPGDMPAVSAASLLAVAAALQHTPVAYAQHRGRRGHPVGFAAELYSELSALEGDVGARRIVARYPHEAVELDDPGVLIDIDTPEDLESARVWWASRGVPLESLGSAG